MPHIGAGALKPFDLVAVDLDGVLIDTATISLRVCTNIAQRSGLDVSRAFKDYSLVGNPTSVIIEKIEALNGASLSDSLKDEIYATTKRLELKPRVFSDVPLFIRSLPTNRALVSNGNLENTMAKLASTGLDLTFKNAVFTRTGVRRPKPAPDVYVAAARAFEARPQMSLAVEDSVVGVSAAKAANFRVIAVVHDKELRDATTSGLLNAGAEVVLDSLASVLSHMEKS